MKIITLILLLSFSTGLLGEELNRCFYTHVREAIELNRERRELYSKDTNGESRKISRYLIIWEKLILLKSRKFDRRAVKFQKMGIPFLCEDFVDMELTPAYTSNGTQIPRPYYKKAEPSSSQIKKTLRAKLKLGYKPFKKQLITEIEKLKQNPSYDCLFRHLLESLLRTADLAPRYLSKVSDLNVKKLDKLIYKYLKLQIFGIGQALFIDRKARSLQSKGHPILCNDVPAVHLSPWK